VTCRIKNQVAVLLLAPSILVFALGASAVELTQTNAVPDAAAIASLRKAADLKDPKAQFRLGQLYASGQGVPLDFKEAFSWFNKAAKQNDPDAQCSLGFCYATGTGVKANVDTAASWYLKAARLGHAEAQFKLAACYERGLGLRTNTAEALKWYRSAAEQGIAEAQNIIGDNARRNSNYEEAVKWYGLAAVRGVASAQYQLGLCYRNGQGTTRDNIEAYKWFLIASGNGHELASEQVQSMAKTASYGMTHENIELAEQRARKAQELIHPPKM
jgi:hypothetical protein